MIVEISTLILTLLKIVQPILFYNIFMIVGLFLIYTMTDVSF